MNHESQAGLRGLVLASGFEKNLFKVKLSSQVDL